MKQLLLFLLSFSLLTAGAQTVFVRIYDGTGPFTNPFWNNWKSKGTGKDTSQTFFDITGNQTKIRSILPDPVTTFDNGSPYLPNQTIALDTALRKGVYESGFSSFSFIGLDDSAKYTITLVASRNRTDPQTTSFSTLKDTVRILADTNGSRLATFTGLRSTSGKITFSWYNYGTSTYAYLNAFTISATPKNGPKAVIQIDSTTITGPNSLVHVNAGKSLNMAYYQWLQTAGPSRAIFTSDTGRSMVISGLFPGTYTFQLFINDSLANTDSAFVSVTVKPVLCPICPTCPPPVVCPVCPICPAPRSATGMTGAFVNGVWTLKFTYTDGNP